MDKKYQIFISSTYMDLKEERRKILDVLLMADCIPAGMEAFVATDVEQFEVIKKVIDLCDYYILIIGKRYGSINPVTQLSYTEMEYNYAIEKGIPVLVFALDSSVKVSPEKDEQDKNLKKKLEIFREKAMKNRLASEWKNVEELTGKVAVAVMKAKTEIDRPGWQRAIGCNEVEFRRTIMELRAENADLKQTLDDTKEILKSYTEESDLAFEDYNITLTAWKRTGDNKKSEERQTSLKRIFVVIATEMMELMISERQIKATIEKQFFSSSLAHLKDEHIVNRLLIQYQKLGLITYKYEKGNLYWGLTQKGKKIRDEDILIKK